MLFIFWDLLMFCLYGRIVNHIIPWELWCKNIFTKTTNTPSHLGLYFCSISIRIAVSFPWNLLSLYVDSCYIFSLLWLKLSILGFLNSFCNFWSQKCAIGDYVYQLFNRGGRRDSNKWNNRLIDIWEKLWATRGWE
jgi:hypothetical protein